MSAHPAELFVVLDEDAADDTLERLRRAFRVKHVASRRLVVVEEAADARQTLRSVPGVVAVASPDIPTELMETLSPEEELFVAAWSRRMTPPARKQRPGDGLPWDAPGFSPPDLPTPTPDGADQKGARWPET